MKDVLLVDDDQICNLISSKTLEKMGFANEIHTALNGKEAINLFNDYYNRTKTLPDLILLDLNMPIMDGFGFLEAFNRLNLPNKGNVKIIIVTSSQNPDDVRRVNELGVSHILSKPVTETKLNEILNSVYGPDN
jgi:CheY-like chemotaxis protein